MEIGKLLIEIIHKTKNYNKWISYVEDRPFNDMRYFINNYKLKQLDGNQQLILKKDYYH